MSGASVQDLERGALASLGVKIRAPCGGGEEVAARVNILVPLGLALGERGVGAGARRDIIGILGGVRGGVRGGVWWLVRGGWGVGGRCEDELCKIYITYPLFVDLRLLRGWG
jgi:hypothetical protein